MNDLEKRSFRSFLGLYIISSFLFIAFIGFWYYTAQKHALENETYYKLQHMADMKAGDIVMAHMAEAGLRELIVPDDIKLALIDTKGKVVQGELIESFTQKGTGYFEINGYNVFVSDAPKEHLGIAYVVTQSNSLLLELKTLQNTVLTLIIGSSIIMVIIAWVLSKLFMRPIRQKVEQIERFINDVTHELNTPITALTMATSQALKQKSYTQKTFKNISISTKQLYDIYSSLTYLNFSNSNEESAVIDIADSLQKSIVYYEPLCESKRITVDAELEEHIITIPEAQLQLLFGNLIGNAIKYSPRGTTITLRLKEGVFSIKDEGIGIDHDKQKDIFKRFKRGTEYSGGFGVGLNIVKSICDEYGIEIELDSAPNEGTEFRLRFP